MMESQCTNTVQHKCSICKQSVNIVNCEIQQHYCFKDFNENIHSFCVDDELNIFMIQQVTNEVPSSESEHERESPDLGKLKWTHDAILRLIDLYKQHLQDFLSTKEKAIKVWGRVSLALQADGFNYTAQQCQFKFKYLKSKYMQKKDNVRRGTGESPITFKYFDAMDNIFGKKPNVRPVNLASNLVKRKVSIQNEASVFEDMSEDVPDVDPNNLEEVPQTQKKEKRNSKSGLLPLVNEMKILQEKQEQRHKENLEMKRQLLDSFNIKMDALINCLNKE